MANIVKRLDLTTDENSPIDLLADDSPKPTIVIDKVGAFNRMTITCFINVVDDNDNRVMSATEIADIGTKYINIYLDAKNDAFGGVCSVIVLKDDGGNITINIDALLTAKPPSLPLV